MSVVVGIETKSGAVLVADTAISDNHIIDTHFEKVFVKHCEDGSAYAVGVVGSARALQVLRYFLECDPPASTADPLDWAVRTLVPELRQLAQDHGPWASEESLDDATGKSAMQLLVAVNGQVLTVSDCYTVTRSPAGYAAIGSGCDIALGALTATEPDTRDDCVPEHDIERAVLAVTVAARWDATVALPHTTIWIPA